jgi:hypothetical protein
MFGFRRARRSTLRSDRTDDLGDDGDHPVAHADDRISDPEPHPDG